MQGVFFTPSSTFSTMKIKNGERGREKQKKDRKKEKRESQHREREREKGEEAYVTQDSSGSHIHYKQSQKNERNCKMNGGC